MATFEDSVRHLMEEAVQNTTWRQKQCFNLIPSEMTPSLLVKMCEISDPAGRYAEHRTMKGNEIYFYQGIDFIKEVEDKVKEEMKQYFNCKEIEPRPISGQMANEVVFKALVKFLNRDRKEGNPQRRITLVMNNLLTHGGHLSSQPMGALFNYVDIDVSSGEDKVVNFPISSDCHYKTDTAKLTDILDQERPELIVFGKSMFLHAEPVAHVYNIVKDWDPRPVIMYDMAHVLGLYGAFQEPLKEGADVVTGSTHKTFFGPQRGIIASNMEKKTPLRKLWLDIRSRAFPGSTSNHHLGTLLGLLMAAYEMNTYKDEYQTAVRNNAKAFAKYLHERGIDVEGDETDGFTETHQVVIRVRKHGNGMDIARRLENSNIITNYQALPDDESFLDPSGIRMGVSEMTRFGMQERDFEMLAEFVADIIMHDKHVADDVSKKRQDFLAMRYCLPKEEAIPLAKNILSVFDL
jgi:glycine/serine hydroxymethyltransferase